MTHIMSLFSSVAFPPFLVLKQIHEELSCHFPFPCVCKKEFQRKVDCPTGLNVWEEDSSYKTYECLSVAEKGAKGAN